MCSDSSHRQKHATPQHELPASGCVLQNPPTPPHSLGGHSGSSVPRNHAASVLFFFPPLDPFPPLQLEALLGSSGCGNAGFEE